MQITTESTLYCLQVQKKKQLRLILDTPNYLLFSFKDFILEHYSEDSSEYEDEIADLMDLRQVSSSMAYHEVFNLQL